MPLSVIRSKRSESQMEFLATARMLQVFTIRKCVNTIPKRYTFFIAEKLAGYATQVHDFVKQGNSIYPTNRHEVQLRRDYFLKAYAQLQSLASQVELAHEIVQFSPEVLQEWSRLIDTELRLVKSVLKADKERYKSKV